MGQTPRPSYLCSYTSYKAQYTVKYALATRTYTLHELRADGVALIMNYSDTYISSSLRIIITHMGSQWGRVFFTHVTDTYIYADTHTRNHPRVCIPVFLILDYKCKLCFCVDVLMTVHKYTSTAQLINAATRPCASCPCGSLSVSRALLSAVSPRFLSFSGFQNHRKASLSL